MIASLPMYWRAETAPAWRRLWQMVQDATDLDLPDLTPPEALPRDLYNHWSDPSLALSMTCGMPFRTRLHHRVTYVGTLDFGLPDGPGLYHSVVIARPHWPLAQPARLAFNGPDSQSGWAAIRSRHPENPMPAFSEKVETGSHAGSLAAVAGKRADIAWIDAVTWRNLAAHDPNAEKVLVVGRSSPTPGLPLICAKTVDPAPLRAALTRAIDGSDAGLRQSLGGLTGLVQHDPADYLAVETCAPA